MNTRLLSLIRENARLTDEQLATMLSTTPDAIRRDLMEMEAEGLIRGYHTVVDWSKLDEHMVTAMIELHVIPRKHTGFDELAEEILQYSEVESLCLMSGGYDFSVMVKGRSFREVANFVATRLATLDGVQSTATHLVLKRYKDSGVLFEGEEKDERGEP
ncbi:MAG: Lrp/AsnC family transcriptional regulator [Clostridia bacterium]|nr:Lrp/AsnC family transcriptional regulator [Clostridia bacterium]